MPCNSYKCVLLTVVVTLQISCRIPRLGVAAQNGACRENEQFTCQNKECVTPTNARCDGVVQCQDGSDEVDCPQSGCILPEQPAGGSFELSPCTGSPCKVEPGMRVSTGSSLTYKCNEGYTLEGNSVSFCLTNAWYMPPRCIKNCPVLDQQTVDIICKYNEEIIPCNSTMVSGTKATWRCKYLYELGFWSSTVKEIVCLDTGNWDTWLGRCQPVCGKRATQKKASTVNGLQDQLGFPWLVTITRKHPNGSYEQICRGNLILPGEVLSAAHCFYNETQKRPVDVSQLIVFAGQYSGFNNFEESGVQKIAAKSIFISGLYSGSKTNYTADSAIIYLASDFTMTPFVSTICFRYNQPIPIEQLRGDKHGKSVGWGKTGRRSTGVRLQELSLPLISREKCISGLPEDRKSLITTDKFCAGYLNGSSVCDNDSGSGLYIQTDGIWYLRGIVSVSPVRTGSCDNNNYTVFYDLGYQKSPSYASYIPVYPTTESPLPGCPLPKHPKNGKYKTAVCTKPCGIEPGSKVGLGSVLIYTCNDDYRIKGHNISVCYEQMWLPALPPPNCTRTQKPGDTEQDRICRANAHFMCENEECVPKADAQCDGIIQCQDGSDEIGCPGSGCTLPDQPIGGSFVLKGCAESACGILQEEKVVSGNFLTYKCDDGYVLKGNIISPCLINAWFQLPTCIRTCPALSSKSVDIVCKNQNEIVSCDSLMIPGTKATLACKNFYTIPLGNDPVYREITCLEDGVWDLAVFKCIPECGEAVPQVTPLVLRGITAEVGDFPWHVGVYQKRSSKIYEQICGGSLVSPDVVVSAAHCFYDDTLNEVMDVGDFGIAGGKYFRNYNFSEPWAQYSKVKSINIAEKYLGFDGNFAHDIALVRLKIPFTIKAVIKPICLDWDNKHENEDLRSGKSGEVAGWGKTATGKPSTILQKTSLPYVPLDNCLSEVPRDFRSLITTDKFCAGHVNGSNVCQGDSGGGLFFEYRGLWFLRGIVSISPKADNFNCNIHYTAFTNIGNFLDWIRNAILNAS